MRRMSGHGHVNVGRQGSIPVLFSPVRQLLGIIYVLVRDGKGLVVVGKEEADGCPCGEGLLRLPKALPKRLVRRQLAVAVNGAEMHVGCDCHALGCAQESPANCYVLVGALQHPGLPPKKHLHRQHGCKRYEKTRAEAGANTNAARGWHRVMPRGTRCSGAAGACTDGGKLASLSCEESSSRTVTMVARDIVTSE